MVAGQQAAGVPRARARVRARPQPAACAAAAAAAGLHVRAKWRGLHRGRGTGGVEGLWSGSGGRGGTHH